MARADSCSAIERRHATPVNQPYALVQRKRAAGAIQARWFWPSNSQVATMVSGLSEMLPMPCSISHWAKSG